MLFDIPTDVLGRIMDSKREMEAQHKYKAAKKIVSFLENRRYYDVFKSELQYIFLKTFPIEFIEEMLTYPGIRFSLKFDKYLWNNLLMSNTDLTDSLIAQLRFEFEHKRWDTYYPVH